MNVRVPESDRQPLRIVLDSALRTPSDARIINREGAVLVIGARDHPQRRASLERQGVEVLVMPAAEGRPALPQVLALLAARGVNELWVEAGAELAGAFVAQRLFDELVVYVAPSLLGGGARGLLELPALQQLEQRTRLRFADWRLIGEDLRVTAVPVDGAHTGAGEG
jgi:diaminohydroxyphosphoribosylaminopyrimidine deaminase/5-amino-6-(5-phosphoribosylamino)uracil reductase